MATKRIALPLSLLLAATVAISYARPRGDRVHLIETGQFHGDEISAKTGQQWLGLYVTERGAMLRYLRLRVTTVFDDVTDYGTKKKTGKRVSVHSSREPLFLLSRTPMLKAGPVISVFEEKTNFDRTLEKSPVHLKLGKKSYVLRVVGPTKGSELCRDNAFPRNARLVLISGKSAQTLYSLDDCGNDPSWYLLWAGDLDRDGKLDLYVNVTQHYDVSERRLFLSSTAVKGKPMKEVAAFVTGGC